MRNQVATLTTLTNDPNGIAESQTPAGAVSMTLDGALVTGGVATFDNAQVVTIDSVGNDSGITFTVTGTDPDGTIISEVVTGGNATTADTVAFFKTVTSVVTSGAAADAVIVGILSANGAVTKSLRVNSKQPNFKLGVFANMSGTLTYSIQYAYEQPEDAYTNSFATDAQWLALDGLSALAADAVGNAAYPVNAVRGKITAYASGTLITTVTQSY